MLGEVNEEKTRTIKGIKTKMPPTFATDHQISPRITLLSCAGTRTCMTVSLPWATSALTLTADTSYASK